MHGPLIIGLGEILWDLLPGGMQLGGAPTNFAWHAQALGARGIPVSCVGRDALGTEIMQRLAVLRLDTRGIAIDPGHPTGTVTVKLDSAGVPSYIIHAPVAWDFIPESPAILELARQAQAVCFGTLAQRSPVSRATIQHFLAATTQQCLRICDINLRQHYYGREVLEQSLAASNVVKLNDQELPVVAAELGLAADADDAVHKLIERYSLRLLALTRGGKGSSLYAADAVSHHPGFKAQLVDTVGAGDAFTAALAVGMLKGHGLDGLNDSANRLASYVCSQPGGTPLITPHVLETL